MKEKNITIPLGLSHGLRVVERLQESPRLMNQSITMDSFASDPLVPTSSGVVIKSEISAQIARVTATLVDGGIRLYLGNKAQITSPLYLPSEDLEPLSFCDNERGLAKICELIEEHLLIDDSENVKAWIDSLRSESQCC